MREICRESRLRFRGSTTISNDRNAVFEYFDIWFVWWVIGWELSIPYLYYAGAEWLHGLAMNLPQLYAIAAGGLFALIFIFRVIVSILRATSQQVSSFFFRHLIYPFILQRHRFWGPWIRLDVAVQIVYWVCTLFFILYGVSSSVDIGSRAGRVALVNMIPLYSVTHLSFLANALRITLRFSRRLHDSIDVMTAGLSIVHVILSFVKNQMFSSKTSAYMYCVLVMKRAHDEIRS